MNPNFLIMLTISALALMPCCINAEEFADEPIALELLIEDFDLLRTSLDAAHPRLGHYRTIEAVRADLEHARRKIDRPMRISEFYPIVAQAVASINDGHTGLDPPQILANDDSPRMPFGLFVSEAGRVWVRELYGKSDLPLGAEILKINGRHIADTVNEILPLMSRDWGLKSGKRAELSSRFGAIYAELIETPVKYTLAYRYDGKVQQAQVNTIPRREFDTARHNARETEPISWEMIGSGLAYIRLNSFSDGNFEYVGRKFQPSINDAISFLHVKEAHAAILDLRQNGGGASANGAYLAAYFIDEPFVYLDEIIAVSDSLPSIDYTQWAEDPKGNQAEYKKLLRERADGRFDVNAPWYSTGLMQPHERTFDGKLYILTDGFVASTGSDFAALMHAHGRAAFIGEMVGGSYDGNASGLTARITLPNSGIKLNLPLFDFQMATGEKRHPSGAFSPDIDMPPWDRVVGGSDPHLLSAVALAEAERSARSALARRLTDYFNALSRNSDFQGVVHIERRSVPIYSRTFGYANLEQQKFHTLDSRFGIASLTKSFTAAGVLRLRDQNLVSLSDTVARFLPEFPNGESITLLHLLRHESGIGRLEDHPPNAPIVQHSSQDIVAQIGALPILFEPGAKSQYSNEGFVVLARIIEVVSGSSWEDFLRANFFEPLNLHETGDRRQLLMDEGLAVPYFPGPPPTNLTALGEQRVHNWIGSGALFSTAPDLAKWGSAVAQRKAIDVFKEDYPYGWGRTDIMGRTSIRQSGMLPGYVSSLQVFPDDETVIAILSNVEHGSWIDWANDTARIIFGDTEVVPVEIRNTTSITYDTESAAPFIGRYHKINDDRFVDISEKCGHLWLRLNDHWQRHYMLPIGQNSFTFRSFSGNITFEMNEASENAAGFRWALPKSWNVPDEEYLRSSEQQR